MAFDKIISTHFENPRTSENLHGWAEVLCHTKLLSLCHTDLTELTKSSDKDKKEISLATKTTWSSLPAGPGSTG